MQDSGASNQPLEQQGQAGQGSASDETLRDTLLGIVQDLRNMVRGEAELARAELKEDATRLGKGAGMIAGSGVLSYTGFLFLMLGVTLLLGRWMKLWLSALLVGLGLTAAGAVVGMSGKKEVQSAQLRPEQTIESLKEDQAWASREASDVAEKIRPATE